MKMYKLKVSGSDDNFNIDYTFSTNFVEYKSLEVTGDEQEKYNKFLNDLEKNGGPQPINIKVKMTTKSVDRALLKNQILETKDVNDFIKKLG